MRYDPTIKALRIASAFPFQWILGIVCCLAARIAPLSWVEQRIVKLYCLLFGKNGWWFEYSEVEHWPRIFRP